MKTAKVHGVECVVVSFRASLQVALAIEALGRDLRGIDNPYDCCALCPASRSPDTSSCCPAGDGAVLVDASLFPLLKLRLPPGTFEEKP